MEPFYIFIIRNDVWIYIISALGLFWFGSELIRAQSLLRRAIFGLEKEKGTRLRNNALGFIALFSAAISVVYYVNAQIAPNLPPEMLIPPTLTPNIFATPLSSPTPLGTPDIVAPSPTPPVVPTITLAGQPGIVSTSPTPGESPANLEEAFTPTPNLPPPTPFVACTTELNFNQPRDGAAVSSPIIFEGTADSSDFLQYKLEANGPETSGQWASLLGRPIDQPVRDGFLGSVNLSNWQSGPYLIRLTLVNTAGYDVQYCVIQVTLSGP
ncbi:MAG: hypothetical protein ACE5E7_11265 [Anaerolineae bacterium]